MMNRFSLPALLLTALLASSVSADVLTLKNGMTIEGKLGKISSIGEGLTNNNSGGEVALQLIVLADDDLRRVYVPSYLVKDVQPSPPALQERIHIDQRLPQSGNHVLIIGNSIRITPFDQWGRRIYTMETVRGNIDVIQGITEITPRYTKVEGLQAENAYIWDMRMRTSSIPRETLSKILRQQLDSKDPDQRLKIVRLYLQAERYQDAALELAEVIRDFPQLSDLKKQISGLRQLASQNLIQEIDLRQSSGQHTLAYQMLSRFPDEGVAGETLLKVRQMLTEYDTISQRRARAVDLLEKFAAEFNDPALKPKVDAAVAEISRDCSINTINRLTDFMRLADDDALLAEEKIALAISGWILGSNNGTQNLAVAISAYDVRSLVQQYVSNRLDVDKAGILNQLKSQEAGTPDYLAKIILNMKPPLSDAEAFSESEIPGYKLMTTPGIPGYKDFQYYVQLPPDYDPYRRYPTIVTLNGGSTPEQQIDWWAGSYNKNFGMRMGQATRHGYIVIAPVWREEHQFNYQYSAQEHAAVLYSLRGAMRQFSIDTDRVFLTGHSMGGDAAWDIGLAHPDLWTGVLPIVASADKYVSRYWENARFVPMYFVHGQYDGNKLEKNARDWDRYLQKNNMDVTVVEYLGRGHEHFQEEIQEMFTWMDLHVRDFMPKEFELATMRPWDNFFYWVEVRDLPQRGQVLPAEWPQSRATTTDIEAKILATNGVSVQSKSGGATVYFTPEMVDFDKRATINIDRRSYDRDLKPTAEVMLEDVRTRADRQHPFWAKVDTSDK
ncbi:carboxylesterase family protein [Blastopirellula retiformator]|uniref:Alpha/beta hydrolase family protein n=1 Tax=Blastopirellula retiformator TaxID=2527970 RepID=A0A5C5VLD7_9BACT|nr:alpha/beta hydrolase-fold protein [Blastopirellula retiformator]TWT39436.1 Alpha/beta hydrolase family protein [Blastopirellula retiformator]